jgi:SNF2 family DNA or RNA helicase
VAAQWPDEARQFAPALRVRTVARAADFDPSMAANSGVWVVSYDTLRRGQDKFGRVPWCVVACDEAQKVKNKTAQTTHVVKALKAKFRVAVSGTPVENSLGELWNLFDLVRPSLLGSYKEFAETFERPIMQSPTKSAAVERLTKATGPFILRRLKANHIEGLPPMTTHVVEVPCSKLQLELIADKVEELQQSGRRGVFLAYAHWVQRCLFDPRLVDAETDRPSAKLSKVVELVDRAWSQGDRSLVVVESLDVQAAISEALHVRFGTAPYIINGAVDTVERLTRVKAFAQHGCPAMIVSPRAGGVGLNITAANHVILPTRLFNPAPEDQAIARAHRMGQTKPVHVHYVVAAGEPETFDQKIHALLESKRQLAATTLFPIERIGLSEAELESALRG